jgi:hypothetical protein
MKMPITIAVAAATHVTAKSPRFFELLLRGVASSADFISPPSQHGLCNHGRTLMG